VHGGIEQGRAGACCVAGNMLWEQGRQRVTGLALVAQLSGVGWHHVFGVRL